MTEGQAAIPPWARPGDPDRPATHHDDAPVGADPTAPSLAGGGEHPVGADPTAPGPDWRPGRPARQVYGVGSESEFDDVDDASARPQASQAQAAGRARDVERALDDTVASEHGETLGIDNTDTALSPGALDGGPDDGATVDEVSSGGLDEVSQEATPQATADNVDDVEAFGTGRGKPPPVVDNPSG